MYKRQGLCRLNTKTNELVFSGAHRPLLLFKDGEMEVIKGDKYPIGGIQYKNKQNFTDYSVKLKTDDAVFVYSDGLPDQMGGDEGRKMMNKRVVNFIEQGMSGDFKDLKSKNERFFKDWIGNEKQMDDVLLLGVKI